MRVSELAKKGGVTAEAVRHYTRLGLIQAERDPKNSYQLYDQTALQRLNFIRQASDLGFSLKQIEEIFQQSDSGDSPCPMVRDLLERKVPETKLKIAQLQAHLVKMEDALAAWESMPNGAPDGHSICCLIEGWETPSKAVNSDIEEG